MANLNKANQNNILDQLVQDTFVMLIIILRMVSRLRYISSGFGSSAEPRRAGLPDYELKDASDGVQGPTVIHDDVRERADSL